MANEKRLIDANALYKTIEEIYDLNYGETMIDPYRFAELVEDADTVNAVEVVHGRWLSGNNLIPTANGIRWTVRCNLCGCPQDFEHNYCPNCGAKMDGDGNE